MDELEQEPKDGRVQISHEIQFDLKNFDLSRLSYMALIFWFMTSAFAEYRVFDLVIQNTQTKAERYVASTLDPFQYPGYYDLNQDEIVMYRETWMCYGDTSYYKPLCPNPKQVQQSQGLAPTQ